MAVWQQLRIIQSRRLYDDAVTYSLTLEGVGALVDLTATPAVPDTMPEGTVTQTTVNQEEVS